MENKHAMLKAGAIHQLDVEGIKKLEFYEDKLTVMEKRLREITDKYTAIEITEQVAGFREELIKNRLELESLKAGFTKEEFNMAYQLERLGKNAALDLKGAKELLARITQLEKEINKLWVRINDFLSRWM
jgi:uncharacterized small protein (DUF1192 family)